MSTTTISGKTCGGCLSPPILVGTCAFVWLLCCITVLKRKSSLIFA